MSLEEARANRQMPFLRRGMRADMDGKSGVITGGDSAHLRMRFDGRNYSTPIHPTWQMTFYAPDGSIVKDYKQKEPDQEKQENRHQQGRYTVWTCICGEELRDSLPKDDAAIPAVSIITVTSCGNCGEQWWIDWQTGALGHGNIDEALLVLRSTRDTVEIINKTN